MNKMANKQQATSTTPVQTASKDTAINQMVLIKDEATVRMMNVVCYLRNTHTSEGEEF